MQDSFDEQQSASTASQISSEKVVHHLKNIERQDLENYARNVEAILMNPPWNFKKKSSSEPGVSIEDFRHLKLPRVLINDGLLFIWTDK